MSYNKRWRPSARQRRDFAIKMQDSNEKIAYDERKKERFWNGTYVPTKEQYDFCMLNRNLADTSEKEDAFNQIIFGYSCNEKISHNYIHIVNELRRSRNTI